MTGAETSLPSKSSEFRCPRASRRRASPTFERRLAPCTSASQRTAIAVAAATWPASFAKHTDQDRARRSTPSRPLLLPKTESLFKHKSLCFLGSFNKSEYSTVQVGILNLLLSSFGDLRGWSSGWERSGGEIEFAMCCDLGSGGAFACLLCVCFVRCGQKLHCE